MWNQRKEALAMFNVCTLVRDQLNKEQAAGEKMEDILKRLIGFYQVTTQKLAMLVMQSDSNTQTAHLSHVLQTNIQVYLAHDEYIDFKALREYLTTTWPEMDVEGAFNPPTKPVFFTQNGIDVCADPNFNVLLEKVAPDLSEVSSARFTSSDEEVERKLYNYWCHIKQRPVPFHELWKYFPEFKKWSLDNGYQVGHSLVRKVELDGYKPDNCSWHPRDQVIKR